MANSTNAKCTLDMANKGGCLNQALVVGKDSTGAIQVYCAEANKAEMVMLMEQAKLHLINSVNNQR